MRLSKALTSYDATVYGMLLSILAPNEKDSKKAEKQAEEIASGCSEREIDRAMNLVDNIVELVQLETTRVKHSNKSWESEVA